MEPERRLTAVCPADDDYPPGRRVVAFIDLLGFKQLVARANTDRALFETLNGIIAGLENEQKRLEELSTLQWGDIRHPFGDLELAHFSDSVVISCPVGDDDLAAALDPVLRLASNLIGDMLQSGIYCRGGVATGWANHRRNVVFGEAMIRAYELESSVAVVPRVVVDDVLVSALPDVRMSALRCDADGSHFINPFEELWSGDQIAMPDDRKYVRVGLQIHAALCRALDAANPAVISKLRWLAQTYNAEIEEIGTTWRRMGVGFAAPSLPLDGSPVEGPFPPGFAPPV